MQSFVYSNNYHAVNYRLFELCEEINAGCDADFDFQEEELEREFAELRLHLTMQA